MAVREFKKVSALEGSKLQKELSPDVAELGQHVNKLQENVDVYTKQLTRLPILDGILLQAVRLTTGQANLVQHSLGRRPLGWIVVRKFTTGDVWEQGDNVFMERTIDLRSSANLTVDLWIF